MRIACGRLLKSCGVHTPPVALKPLCDHLSISIKYRNTLGKATLRSTDQGFELWINSVPKYWRHDRFTIAHEIAHVLLITTLGDLDLLSSLTKSEDAFQLMEALCDVGALELLMPANAIRANLGPYGLRVAGLQAMYDHFLVSYRALLMRISRLIPSASVSFWRKYSRSGSEISTLRVIRSYPPYRLRARSTWLPKGTTTKHVLPDIVSRAVESRELIESDSLHMDIGSAGDTRGIAGVLPLMRRDTSQVPLFSGQPVADEEGMAIDAFLITVPNASAPDEPIWNLLRGAHA